MRTAYEINLGREKKKRANLQWKRRVLKLRQIMWKRNLK
jgi:hypothetical protein